MMLVTFMVLPFLAARPVLAQDTLKLDLGKALEIALSENPTVKVADKEIQKKKYARKGSYASLFPQISFAGDYNRTLKKQVMYMDFDMGDMGGGSLPEGTDMSSMDEGENITLCMEDDSQLVSLWQTAYGALSDANGNTLTAMDYIMLLPTPEDDLNQTAAFPGGFTNVTIDYPIQMEAHEQPNVSNALSFNAVMEDGTDDYYSNIMIAFQPIEGFDPYMEKGAATAKTYMVKMLDDFMKSMYGSYLIKSFGSDFKDNGDYYSLTGYMWLDGDVFSGDLTQPVRGCMEVRYYGPTGYALVATTIALEGRIRNYFDICSNMLTTLSYTAGWSTAPKPVPAQPAYSGDSGDYGTPYYWYDEDGDVWYWNGYENEFISYGSDGYIDDDTGEYMESNDAGWDYSDEYYDDYDPWSDPGDGWGDYTEDDGWGDYF